MGEWTGTTIEGGLWEYDKGKWHQQDVLDGMIVTALLEANDGSLWAGTERGGLWKYDGQSWYSFTTLDGLPSARIAELLQDQRGTLWVGTGAGIARYRFNENPPIIKIKTVDDEEMRYFSDQDDDLYNTGKPNVFVSWSAFDKETPAGRLTTSTE